MWRLYGPCRGQSGPLVRGASGCRGAESAGGSAKSDRPDVIARPPRIAYLLLAIGALLEWFRPLSLLPPGWPAALHYGLGGLLVVLGLAVVTVALRAFRRAGTNVETQKPTIALVTDGVYAWSRNPMYVALALLFRRLDEGRRDRLGGAVSGREVRRPVPGIPGAGPTLALAPGRGE